MPSCDAAQEPFWTSWAKSGIPKKLSLSLLQDRCVTLASLW